VYLCEALTRQRCRWLTTVVKLFNAILVASQTNPTNPAALVNNERKSKKEKDNILGRGGREDRLTKEGFLDMIKSGGK
jgi:hypothetical protein